MSFNLLDAVKNHFSPGLVSQASSFLGENEGGVIKALTGIIPAVMGGLVNKGTSSDGAAREVLDLARNTNRSGILSGMGNILSGEGDWINKGSGLLTNIFGDKASNIINTIASFAGIKNSSASSLMSLAAPVGLGTLGKYAEDNNLDANGLKHFLSSQKNAIMAALPAGLGALGGFFGDRTTDISSETVRTETTNIGRESVRTETHTYEPEVIERKSGTGWLWPLLLLLLAALAVWYFWGREGCGTPAERDTTVVDTSEQVIAPVETETSMGRFDSATGNYVYEVGNMITINLADGKTMQVGENSTENKIYQFLNNSGVTVDTMDKTKGWITLDRVYFETGSSKLTTESQTQLQNIANILSNFSSATAKLGGYTDNTGSEETNKRISGMRAKSVLDQLTNLGVQNGRLESEGYGPQHPVCPANDTPECMAKNRRVDIRVTGK